MSLYTNNYNKYIKPDAKSIHFMFEILTAVCQGNLIPEEWTKDNMSLVFKKWDTTDPYNWYPVYLLNCTYTTIAHIIADRMNPHVCNNELEAQYGCLQEKGCTNAFFPLKIALQLRKEHDIESFVVSSRHLILSTTN